MTILADMKQAIPSLSKAERSIAETVLSAPESIINITTAELARLSDVSDPMISRFCRRLGCQSFPDFKVQLAKGIATQHSLMTEAVSSDDDTASYIHKRINANQAALEYIRSQLSPESIEKAVDLMKTSRQIIIFGMGGAAAIAKDAQHKLFRLGIPTVAYEDHLMQRMAATAADKNTVILIFSFTGRTTTTIDVAKIAKASKAKVVAVTNAESPLSAVADLQIPSGNELEDTTIYVPMTTRIVILTIIDILATGLALALGSAVEERLHRVKHCLDETKI